MRRKAGRSRPAHDHSDRGLCGSPRLAENGLFGLRAVESSGRAILSNEAGGALVLATVVFRQGESCRRAGGIGDLDRHVVSDDGLSIGTARCVEIASRTPGHEKGDKKGALHGDRVAPWRSKSIVPKIISGNRRMLQVMCAVLQQPRHQLLRFSPFNQVHAVVAAVAAQTATMIRNVPDTPTVSANIPTKGAPIRPLPTIPLLYMAMTRPRTSSRALSCKVLATVTLKKPLETPSKNMPANAK